MHTSTSIDLICSRLLLDIMSNFFISRFVHKNFALKLILVRLYKQLLRISHAIGFSNEKIEHTKSIRKQVCLSTAL